ncbi:MAG: DUF86 domain-containing protein [Phycisphaerales bacterium]|nr:DUF86 domain-containing protein [Hyphomonadaceae bacterium]
MPRDRSPRHRLFDMLNSIKHIESMVAGSDEQSFSSDLQRYRAVERELEIISEASRSLSNADKARFPEIPWRRIADIGNVLRHNYDDVAPSLVWGVVSGGLEPLKAAARTLYAEVKRPADPWPDAEP